MGFLKKLSSLLSPAPQTNSGREYWIHVRCKRCGEEIRSRVDLWNELSWTDSDSGDRSAYTARKVLMGSGKCFQQIEINLAFDSSRRVIGRQVTGGEFVD
jgi:hypothetical protein